MWYNRFMLSFREIADAIPYLTSEEQARLRSLIDAEIAASSRPPGNGTRQTSKHIGLFADEPELMDQVMESAYEHRSRPLRIDESP
jgi:hypothetical protein